MDSLLTDESTAMVFIAAVVSSELMQEWWEWEEYWLVGFTVRN